MRFARVVMAQPSNENKISHSWRERAWRRDVNLNHGKLGPYTGQRLAASLGLGGFISAPAKSRPTRIELYPREFVFRPYRGLWGKALRIVEGRYGHINPFRTDFVLDKQRRATTRGERA
jgi:hypothetical protein